MTSTALLLADDDAGLRALLGARARNAVADLAILEAEDGAEAVRLGLQRRPQLALLDVQMPRLGGIEAAITLRELHPHLRIALHTADPSAHRERARDERLPLFDKLELERVLRWLELQAEAIAPKPARTCSVCGYGVARSAPPERCPMCQGTGTWLPTPRQASSGLGRLPARTSAAKPSQRDSSCSNHQRSSGASAAVIPAYEREMYS